jgi:hypothetical protein
MFGKVKKILGIEGVKLELIIPEKVSAETGIITGIIKFTALSNDNGLESIHLILVEKYTRGRGNNTLINEYILGELKRKENITVSKNEILEIPFEMEFTHVKSEMDKLGDSNFFAKGLVFLAKKARAVKSEYTIRAEAKIKGTTLNPFDIKTVMLE